VRSVISFHSTITPASRATNGSACDVDGATHTVSVAAASGAHDINAGQRH
jgi:hypothetical protein